MIANGILYAPREDGALFVASVKDDQFKLISENGMDEPVIGSPDQGHHEHFRGTLPAAPANQFATVHWDLG